MFDKRGRIVRDRKARSCRAPGLLSLGVRQTGAFRKRQFQTLGFETRVRVSLKRNLVIAHKPGCGAARRSRRRLQQRGH